MTNPTPVESPCQAKEAPPLQEGTILDCPDCHAAWRFHPRGLAAAREEMEAFGAVVNAEERSEMLRACRIPRCPGCSRLSGTPATDQLPPDLDLSEVGSILEAAGFVKEDSEPAAFVVDANFPVRELWLFEGTAGTGTDTPTAPGGIDVSPDKLPEEPRIAQAPRLVSVTLRALTMDVAEPLRSPVGWIKVLSGGSSYWPVDRKSLDSDLKQALSWVAAG